MIGREGEKEGDAQLWGKWGLGQRRNRREGCVFRRRKVGGRGGDLRGRGKGVVVNALLSVVQAICFVKAADGQTAFCLFLVPGPEEVEGYRDFVCQPATPLSSTM